MLEYCIRSATANFRLSANVGFSTWARKPPGEYLRLYPIMMKKVFEDEPNVRLKMLGIVDDVLPRLILSRSEYDQSLINDQFSEAMNRMGYDRVCFVTKDMDRIQIAHLNRLLSRFTFADFNSVLPEVKLREDVGVCLSDLFEFVWHVRVLQLFLEDGRVDAFATGIRTERFYLTARKALPDHSLFFAKKNR